jgi:carbon monoxide dehydrogenase subunit G
MEVKLDKRYPIAATPEQAWTVLADIRAVAGCMPGAQITEQVDDTHYKGTVKSKIGPAVMSFGGDIELQGLDAAARSLKMMAKGADKAGSSASMQLTARLEPGDSPVSSTLVGQATIVVSGKLAQFGSRLLVPVSDAMLAQFAANFQAAAAAVPAATQQDLLLGETTAIRMVQGSQAPAPLPAEPTRPLPPPAKELNALSLMWTVMKNWFGGLFGKKS